MYTSKIILMLYALLISYTPLAFSQNSEDELTYYLNNIGDPDDVALSLIPYLNDDNPDVRFMALADIILTESNLSEVSQVERDLLNDEPSGPFRDLLEIGLQISSGTTAMGTDGSTYVSPDGKDMWGTLPTGAQAPGMGTSQHQGSTPEGMYGGCYRDSSGQLICVDPFGGSESSWEETQGKGTEGFCYVDPKTGNKICLDSNRGSSSSEEGMHGNGYGEFSQEGNDMYGTIPASIQTSGESTYPQSLHECENGGSEICGTWTLQGSQYIANWENGASAALNIERWGDSGIVLTRYDSGGSSAGLSARYEGRLNGNRIENGKVTWNWNGNTWSGTWSASW